MSGEIEPMLQIPDMPFSLSHLVSLYSEIGEFSYNNLHAFQSVTGRKFACYEIETLKAIEQARTDGVNYVPD